MSDPFSPQGVLAEHLPGFEYRPQQGEMAQVVTEALADGGVALIEAGTGTGKSLAYLIPAARYAIEAGRPVVISTNTINLQEQLIQKDIPWVQQKVAPDLKAVLVKGWQNYLCLHRYEGVLRSPGDLLDSGEEGELAAIRKWVTDGPEEGSRNELPFTPSSSLWSKLAAESDTCMRQECPFYDHCYLFRARRAIEGAHLLIVNHHLLFADVAVRDVLGWESEAVLPAYSHVVLDEAHHVEDVATEHLGHRFTELGWRQYLGRVARTSRSGQRRGHLATIVGRLQTISSGGPIAEQINTDVFPAVDRAREAGGRFFSLLADWAATKRSGESGENVWPIDLDAVWLDKVQPEAEALRSAIQKVAALLKEIGESLRELGDEWKALAQETDALATRARLQTDVVDWLTTADDPTHVFWVEARMLTRGLSFSLVSAPIDVGSKLSEWMNEGLSTAVMCSATLAVEESFDYILNRLGFGELPSPDLSDHGEDARLNVRTVAIESPFDFAKQSAIYVPADIAEPTDPRYAAQFTASLAELLTACKGRAFVLFTSYTHLRNTAAKLRPILNAHDIPLWVQGEGGRSHLLNSFVSHPGSVLFGTDSFWEGVDVQGSALSLVVIARLPFDVPTHPVAQARTQRLIEQGLNPFRNYSLPRAALKLKQGFGRLIRSKSDQGVVAIYDRRIISRSYGRVLLGSLPPAPLYVRNQQEFVNEIAERLHAYPLEESV